MALVGLEVISIFKCKRRYRSHVYSGIMEKMMVRVKLWQFITPSGEFMFVVLFMFISCNSLQIVSLA